MPDVTGAEVLQLCASSIRDPDLKERLQQAEAVVEAAEKMYREHGQGRELHAIKGTNTVGGFVTRKEIERVYNGTFVKSRRTRSTYAKLKKACVDDICPLCGQGTVHQLV